MELLDFLKSKKKRREEARVKEVLKRTDETIERIEAGLEKLEHT